MKKKNNTRIGNFILPIFPALLVFILIVSQAFYSLNEMLCDLVYRQVDGPGEKIKIIGIDEETLKEYGPLNTWIREGCAELVELLYAESEHKPAVTAFDIMFIGENDTQADEKLLNTISGQSHIVLGTNLVYRGKTKKNSDGSVSFDAMNISMEERPFDALDEICESGFTNMQILKDGFVRISQLSAVVDGQKRYSFSTQIYLEYMNCLGNNTKLPETDANERFRFFYSGEPGEFEHYSMKDVLEGKIPVRCFEDCIVLVGAYAPGLQDAYQTPVKRSQVMYGVEIHANIVKALMDGKTAVPLHKGIYAGIVFAVIYLYVLLERKMKMAPAIILGAVLLAVNIFAGRMLATNGRIISLFPSVLVVILIWIWIVIEKYVLESIRKRRILHSFRKYMAPQVVDKLAREGDFHIELGGEMREVAVLFVDIRGFTTMSEAMKPDEVVQILNQYLSLTTQCIFAHGGMLDKFVGDATMAVFNAPTDQEDYLFEAVQAALDMQKKGRELGEKLLKEHGKTVSFGIGVHVGEAIVGNIGCDTRMDYTAIGDTVNTAARLESRAGKGEILVSDKVIKLLGGRIKSEFHEDMLLKGKAEPVSVYKVLGQDE